MEITRQDLDDGGDNGGTQTVEPKLYTVLKVLGFGVHLRGRGVFLFIF